MRRAACLATAALLSAAPGAAHGQWSGTHKAAAAAAVSGIALDCASTAYALGQGYVERNPLLPRRPDAFELTTACLLGASLTLVAGDLLPNKGPWRTGFLALVAGISVLNALHNATGISVAITIPGRRI